MSRRLRSAAACIAPVLLIACGAGHAPPSRHQLAVQASGLCARLNAEVRRLPRPTRVESPVTRLAVFSSDMSETADAFERLARANRDAKLNRLARGIRRAAGVSFDLYMVEKQPTPDLLARTERELPAALDPLIQGARGLGAAACEPSAAERTQFRAYP